MIKHTHIRGLVDRWIGNFYLAFWGCDLWSEGFSWDDMVRSGELVISTHLQGVLYLFAACWKFRTDVRGIILMRL
jgi:hypothetical protein